MTNTHICHSERSEESAVAFAFAFSQRAEKKQIPRAKTALGMTTLGFIWRGRKFALAAAVIVSATSVGPARAERPQDASPTKPVTVTVDGNGTSSPMPTEMMEAT